MEIEAYGRSRNRRNKTETLFASLNHSLALARLGLRGFTGAKNEFLLRVTVQNLKGLAKLAAIPPPQPIMA
jgi:hypothetical protein